LISILYSLTIVTNKKNIELERFEFIVAVENIASEQCR